MTALFGCKTAWMQTTGEGDMAGSTRQVTGKDNRAAVRGRLSRDLGTKAGPQGLDGFAKEARGKEA